MVLDCFCNFSTVKELLWVLFETKLQNLFIHFEDKSRIITVIIIVFKDLNYNKIVLFKSVSLYEQLI